MSINAITIERVARPIEDICIHDRYKLHSSVGWPNITGGSIVVSEIQKAIDVPSEAGQYIANNISNTTFWSEEIAETLSGYFIGFEYYELSGTIYWLPLGVFVDHITVI